VSQRKKVVPLEKLYRDMSSQEKVSFIGKACIFFLSGGFIYPTIWID